MRTKSNDFPIYVTITHLFDDDVDHLTCGTFEHSHGYWTCGVWHSGSIANTTVTFPLTSRLTQEQC